MSQLISDFIIEPVVRQARRFSRRDSTSTILQSTTDQFTENSESEATSSAIVEEIPSTQSQPAQATGSGPVEFPEYVDPIAGETAEIQAVTERIRTIPRLEQARHDLIDSTAEARTRAETDPEGQRHQQRPPGLVRERFRSANASFPSTINEAGSRFMSESNMSTTSGNTRTIDDNGIVDSKLPEDDGMRDMRKRILDIQATSISNEEKSRLIHHIMLEQYVLSGANSNLRAQSPSSLKSHERPLTPVSGNSIDIVRMESPATAASIAVEEVVVTTSDLKPTYWIPPPPPIDATPEASRKNSIDEDRQFGCEHYKRNVKLQCSACFKWYTCRFCHDRVEDHCLNRQATKNMLCMNCGTPQPASGDCRSCGFCAAYYYCKLCKLWDDDSTKAIYHCDSCGICRRGEGLGRDFFHCQKCSACISMRLLDNHKCIERSTDCDCPICGEYMFTSPRTVVFMRCGHSIHYVCWTEHMKNSYKCPICSKSMVNMDLTFRQYDNDIAAQPMPPQFKDTKAWIFCNDCANKSLVPFHWVGLKCATCDSYNTARLHIISAPEDVDLGAAEIDVPVPEVPAATVVVPAGGQAVAMTNPDSNSNPSSISPAGVSTVATPRQHIARSRTGTNTTRTGDIDVMETAYDDNDEEEEDEDDMAFWGGTSPRERAVLEAEMRARENDENSSSSEDGGGDAMDEDDDEDEEEDDDQMAIFGHR